MRSWLGCGARASISKGRRVSRGWLRVNEAARLLAKIRLRLLQLARSDARLPDAVGKGFLLPGVEEAEWTKQG